jgi:hypothetical protein
METMWSVQNEGIVFHALKAVPYGTLIFHGNKEVNSLVARNSLKNGIWENILHL